MGSTPNYETAGTGGYNPGNDAPTNTAAGNVSDAEMRGGSPGGSRTTNMPDDVSFSQPGGTTGQEGALSSTKDSMKRGITDARGAMDQLQQKASDMTSRLINNIDADDITQKLETQVREHPARTLMAAVGAGFLLGRAVKR